MADRNTATMLIPVVTAVLVVLFLALPVWAYEAPECVEVGVFTVCFEGVDDAGDVDPGSFKWTYSVTSDEDLKTNAMSHWTLDVGGCYLDDVDPGDGETYTTIGSYTFTDTQGVGRSVSGGREDISYDVVLHKDSADPTTGVFGIKWEDPTNTSGASDTLGDDGIETDIFQFTTYSSTAKIGDVALGIKAGSGEDVVTGTNSISGPVCDPTAVTMASLSARVESGRSLSTTALLALLLLVPAGLVIHTRYR